jgi:hypothetical protein
MSSGFPAPRTAKDQGAFRIFELTDNVIRGDFPAIHNLLRSPEVRVVGRIHKIILPTLRIRGVQLFARPRLDTRKATTRLTPGLSIIRTSQA